MKNTKTFLKLSSSLFLGMGIISGSSIKSGEAAQNRQPDPRQCARAKSFTERMCAEPPRCKAARKKEEQQCGQARKLDSHSPATPPSPHPQSVSGSPSPASDELSEQDKNVLKGYIAKGYKPVIMHKDMMDKFWSPSKIRKAEQYVNELNNAKAPHPHSASEPASPASDELSKQDKSVLKEYIAEGYPPVIMHRAMMDNFWSPTKIRKAEQYVNELNNAKAPHPHNASGSPSPASSAPAGSAHNPVAHPANQPTTPPSPHPHNASGSPSPASDKLSEQDKKALEKHAADADAMGFIQSMGKSWSPSKRSKARQYVEELYKKAELSTQEKAH